MRRFVDEVRMLELPRVYEDDSQVRFGGGDSSFVEVAGERDIPFEIKRIFYICGAGEGNVRGKHANRRSRFVLTSISGSCKVRVVDERGAATEFTLDSPERGLYLPEMVWKEMYDFSSDCVLMALSNERYDAAEYIRDFDEFVREVEEVQLTKDA